MARLTGDIEYRRKALIQNSRELQQTLKFFPTPLPDETLYSLVSRYHLLSGNITPKITFTHLFRKQVSNPASVFPSELNHFEQVTEGYLGSECTALQLTLYPYFRPFLATEKALLIERRMYGNYGQSLERIVGCSGGGISSSKHLRFCPICIREDQSSYGVCYWHRSHQLPGALVCFRHNNIWLSKLNSVSHKALRHAACLPDHSFVKQPKHPTSPPPSALIKLAQASHELLIADLPVLNGALVRKIYKQRLSEMGLTKAGFIRQGEVHALFQQKYVQLFEHPAFHKLAKDPKCKGDWLSHMLTNSRRDKHPAKHLLVILWLFDSFLDFQRIISNYKEFSSANSDKPDRESEQLGNSDTSISVHTAITNTLSKSNPLTPHRTSKSLELHNKIKNLLLKGIASKEVSKRVGVTVRTVNRIASSSEPLKSEIKIVRENRFKREQRSRVINYLREYPETGVSKFREKFPALHSWFSRNDFAWYRSQFPAHKYPAVRKKNPPPSPKYDWDARDRTLARKICNVAKMIHATENKPPQISRTLLLNRIKATYLVKNNGYRLPATEAALKKYSETLEEAQIRRVWTVATFLRENRKHLSRSSIQRLAGLRQKIAPRVEDAITHALRFENPDRL